MGNAPLQTKVLNLARGVAGGYVVRLLADLGAECSRWKWCEERPGDWPTDTLFQAYFREGIEQVARPLSPDALLDALVTLAPAFDLIVTDFARPEMEPGEMMRRLRPFNPALVVANV